MIYKFFNKSWGNFIKFFYKPPLSCIKRKTTNLVIKEIDKHTKLIYTGKTIEIKSNSKKTFDLDYIFSNFEDDDLILLNNFNSVFHLFDPNIQSVVSFIYKNTKSKTMIISSGTIIADINIIKARREIKVQ